MTDARSVPFKKMVVMGESLVEDGRWVSMLGEMIGRFQGVPVETFNKGISANVISPRNPGYEASSRPSVLERFRRDVIALEPDLFILSCGLNDMRAGMHPEHFRQDMRSILVEVKSACNPTILLTTLYHMVSYGAHAPFDRGSRDSAEVFNLVIKQIAGDQGCLLADIWDAQGQADWVIHPDGIHSNELGYFLVANRVFGELARRCSGVCSSEPAKQ